METPNNGSKPSHPEVLEHTARRRFTGASKLKLSEEAARCSAPEEIGALLRREGLYSSHLTNWCRQRRAGAAASMLAVKRGRPAQRTPEQGEIEQLRRENERLRGKLRKAEKIIEAKKTLCLPPRKGPGPDIGRGAQKVC